MTMEITTITLHRYALPLAEPFVTSMRPIYDLERILIEVETNTGLVGLGEAAPAHEVTGETGHSTYSVLEDVLAPYVIGRDPLALERLTADMKQFVDGAPAAHAGLEIAFQDLRGKHADMPLFKLLGGHGDTAQVTAPAVLSMDTPAAMAEAAIGAVEDGYSQLKIKVGDDPQTDIDRITHVANTIPDDVSLKVDVNQAWQDATTTRRVLNALDVEIDALEQPVAPGNITDLATITEHSAVAVMPDESVKTAVDATNLIQRNAGDIYNIKLMKTGGILEAERLNAVADAAHRPTQLGSNVEGDVGTAAGIHFVAAHDNVQWNELVGPFMTTERITDLTTSKPDLATDGSGLGVTLDRDTLEDLRIQHTVID